MQYGKVATGYHVGMASLLDLRRQVDILDRQMVELLSRRTVLVKQIIRILEEE